MEPKRAYASDFLEESLGLPKGSVEPGAVPAEFVDALADAMKGSESSRSPEPSLEKLAQSVGRDILESILETCGFVVFKERWPDGARYAACLTHDVDSISRPLLHILRRRRRFSAADLLLALTGLRNPYDNISHVVGLERDRGFRSSFYFLSGEYDLSRKRAELDSVARAGWDLGLHGDFGTHDSEPKMTEALARVKRATGISPTGVREHYLRFDFGSTWGIMEKAGLAYDSTVGNSDRLGFRLGLCNPFHPPDENWTPRRLLELPLVLMDATLWGYLKATEADGLREFDLLKRSVESVNGLFTILWHQEALRMKGGRIYPRLLDVLKKDGCFVGSGLAVAQWWLRRATPLVADAKTFRMEDAPAGLVLRARSKGGQVAEAAGAEVSPAEGGAVIKAKGGPLVVAFK